MSLHDDIAQRMRGLICEMQSGNAVFISPSALAIAVYDEYSTGGEDPHVAYGAIEHNKQIARTLLRNRFDADGDDSVAYQDDMFTNRLQDYYPTPRDKNEEPQYKRLDTLTHFEGEYNIAQLEKSAKARLEHARALRAYFSNKFHAA